MTTTFTRRQLMLGSAAALALAGVSGGISPVLRASAALPERYDTVEEYEKAWEAVGLEPTHNEEGKVAWMLAYGMLSLIRMYEATDDTTYLDRFVDMTDGVWNNTDKARGVTDHFGTSARVWRAGANYAASGVDILDANGAKLFEVRYASAAPADATVTVETHADGTFDLHLAHPSTGEKTLAGLTTAAGENNVLYRMQHEGYEHARRWTVGPEVADGTPVAGTYQLEQRFNIFAVHTGMTTYPMVLFARIVIEEGLQRYLGAARRYIAWARQSAAYHDDEFEYYTLDDGTEAGDFRFPRECPTSWDGLIQPLNQSHGLGQTYAELYRINPRQNAEYGRRVRAMVAAFFESATVVDGAYHWPYWPTRSELYQSFDDPELSTYTHRYLSQNKTDEDISHAAITIEFLYAASNAGLGVSDEQLAGFARTYTDWVWRDDERVWMRVTGEQEAGAGQFPQAGRWLPLQEYDDRMADHVNRVLVAGELEPTAGSHLLSMSYIIWAKAEGWLR